MTLGEAFIYEANTYVGCKETSPNRSTCVDVFHAFFDGTEIKSESWCAEFVSFVMSRVFPFYGHILPIFYKTKSTLAMVDLAKKHNVPVTDYPSVGSVFFTERTGGGHVGFVSDLVWDTDGNLVSIKTIEGNSFGKDQDNATYEGVVLGTRKMDGSVDYLFMNWQTLSSLNVPQSLVFAPWTTIIEVAAGATAILAGYFTWKNGIKETEAAIKHAGFSKTKWW